MKGTKTYRVIAPRFHGAVTFEQGRLVPRGTTPYLLRLAGLSEYALRVWAERSGWLVAPEGRR